MDSIELTETDLNRLAREATRQMGLDRESEVRWKFNSSGVSQYLLLEFGARSQHHFRLDLLKFANNRFQTASGPSMRDPYKYKVTSLHVKAEENYGEGGDFHAYLYLNYVGGGVWQPIWGYSRKLTGPPRRIDLTARELTSAYRDCHQFMAALSTATGTAHGLACGPVQESDVRFEDIGLQGEGIGRL